MADIEALKQELVTANHILAHEGVVDAYGHVSVRNPDAPERFFLARSRSPELVEMDDILEFGLDGEPVLPVDGEIYLERFIHAAIFEARPDVHSVVHSHAEEIIPYGITNVPLRPVFHVAARMGHSVPVWDIRDNFGDTDMLVVNLDQGRDMAKTLEEKRVVLMRGHGFTVAAESLYLSVFTAIYTRVNARVQSKAMEMGEVNYLSPGEIERAVGKAIGGGIGQRRAWEYLSRRAGTRAQS
jgi:HCOMODA/2-hydroxy-3-carboxy-muconic semialdehyde decarboxylase